LPPRESFLQALTDDKRRAMEALRNNINSCVTKFEKFMHELTEKLWISCPNASGKFGCMPAVHESVKN
jgi:hypothetical protein